MWSLPGGAIEPGETPAEAAVRETHEETGYQCELATNIATISHYQFRWDGLVYDCECHWFLATPLNDLPKQVDDAQYLLGARWLPADRVIALMSYHPHIQKITRELLDSAAIQ